MSLEYASNASNLHISFGKFLEQEGYDKLGVLQEVPVKDIWNMYPNGRDRFDYFIPTMNLVIELHGAQHYKPVNFGGVRDQKASEEFRRRVQKDIQKAAAALDSKTLYIAFSYEDDINEESFRIKIKEAQEDLDSWEPLTVEGPKPKKFIMKSTKPPETHEEKEIRLKKAREDRAIWRAKVKNQ